MRTDYAQIFQSDAAVAKYEHVVYAPDSYSTAVSARQRAYLRRLVRRQFPERRPVQHDFACGTGRAVRMLAGLVTAAHGYDTSPAMLDRARGVPAALHLLTADQPPRPVPTAGPAVVTVFRFLLNSPPAARDAALAFAAWALPHPDAGYLVVENHGPSRSLRALGRRRHTHNPWYAELSHVDVTALLRRHRFNLVHRHGFGLCPAGAYRRPLTRPLARTIDAVADHLSHAAVATDVLYIARRTT